MLTGEDCLESFLHFCNDSLYMWRRTSPKHKAVSWVLEAWFDGLIFQLCEDGIDSDTCKV